ncbi:acyl-CoA dehydrogenase [Ochrobactrum intermedium]|uniref:Acyl-CoA dehydrogenase n=2 Tax=Brucella intermedia TaxID=94625 RepID=A0ABR6AI94_9HYPH|nr:MULTISPECIES: acyl-CoA dehydrogenase family protein [Brucella/Ochrobactrum group]ERI13990.1 acyl-CoA dehydrogenase [Ochrobactrum sp. EGD-AQ16]KAB2696637.1 acyl-CoA dehydrogenase [Brucella intermedia]KAB2708863.1 acyl-CoA dehydrogenase [Brucella intermedia]MBA8849165.1 acyl-CoA dehydrogenase [Brucella intermedia]MDH0122440.1 acyl-CoA/acyl-ACP dehydrogenase [Brucella intermedia GD04153]
MNAGAGNSLSERAGRVAAIAGKFSDSVDKEGRFPREAIDAMKAEGLLGIQVPSELGGESAEIDQIAELCCILGQSCASSAMIFAMHHIKLSSLVEHGQTVEWHRDFMRKIAKDQLLLASATTEGGIGGDLRNSICAIEVQGDKCRLEKNATVISYGTYADAILITSRSHKDAASSDQVMTVFLKDQYTLEKTHDWDTLGMRGTCSEGFVFRGEADKVQILPHPFAEIAAQSMLAQSHTLWSSLWYGIAVDAVNRAQAFVRAAAKRNPGAPQPGALRVAEASNMLQMLKSEIVACLKTYREAKHHPDKLASMGFAIAMNNLKIAASQMILQIINHAMLVCGIMGYKNDTPFSLGRHLRDAHSAQLMISNERILGNTATMLLIHKQNTSLLG